MIFKRYEETGDERADLKRWALKAYEHGVPDELRFVGQTLPADFDNIHYHGLIEMPVPKGAVVYFLVNENRIIYIGKASALFTRVGSHICNKTFDRLFYLRFDTIETASKVEKALIRLYRPRLNWTDAKGSLTDEHKAVLKYMGLFKAGCPLINTERARKLRETARKKKRARGFVRGVLKRPNKKPFNLFQKVPYMGAGQFAKWQIESGMAPEIK